MRNARLLVGVAAVSSMIAAIATGCSNSDSTGGGDTNAPDGSTTNPGGDSGTGTKSDGSVQTGDGSTGTTTTVTASASDVNVYLGQVAQLDATASTVSPAGAALTYSWTLVSAPPGSAVVTASLFNAGSAKPTFTPDVAGEYKLKVTVASGTATNDKTVSTKAYEANAVYFYTEGDGGAINQMGMRAAATVSDAGTRDLSCNVIDGGAFDQGIRFNEAFSGDYWEAPAGSDSKIVYSQLARVSDGGSATQLVTATTASTCATATTLIDELESTNQFFLNPKFSPNGQRLSYTRSGNEPDRVYTVAADGSDKRIIGSLSIEADGGPLDAAVQQNNRLIQVTRWLSDTKVAWMQFPGSGSSWQIVVADDSATATPAVYMTCSSLASNTTERPSKFDFLPDGSVIVGQRTAFGDSGLGPEDILVFKPDATTKACTLVRNLTNQANDGGVKYPAATNFELSPDHTRIAYLVSDPNLDGGNVSTTSVWTASVDGLTPPAPLPNAPARGAIVGVGPRWLAGGALLSWPQDQRSLDAGTSTNPNQTILVAPAAGGAPRIVDNSGSGATGNVFAISTGSACTIAAGGGSGLAGLGALGAIAALFGRRRRRN